MDDRIELTNLIEPNGRKTIITGKELNNLLNFSGLVDFKSQTGFSFYGNFNKGKIENGYLTFPKLEIFEKLKCSSKTVKIETKEPITFNQLVRKEIKKQINDLKKSYKIEQSFLKNYKRNLFQKELVKVRNKLKAKRRNENEKLKFFKKNKPKLDINS